MKNNNYLLQFILLNQYSFLLYKYNKVNLISFVIPMLAYTSMSLLTLDMNNKEET